MKAKVKAFLRIIVTFLAFAGMTAIFETVFTRKSNRNKKENR